MTDMVLDDEVVEIESVSAAIFGTRSRKKKYQHCGLGGLGR